MKRSGKMKVFKHKKTGKLYEIVQDRILFKDISNEEYDYDIEGRPTCVLKREFEWRGQEGICFPEHFILYRALYNDVYYVRHADDFYNSFEEIVDDNVIISNFEEYEK